MKLLVIAASLALQACTVGLPADYCDTRCVDAKRKAAHAERVKGEDYITRIGLISGAEATAYAKELLEGTGGITNSGPNLAYYGGHRTGSYSDVHLCKSQAMRKASDHTVRMQWVRKCYDLLPEERAQKFYDADFGPRNEPVYVVPVFIPVPIQRTR